MTKQSKSVLVIVFISSGEYKAQPHFHQSHVVQETDVVPDLFDTKNREKQKRLSKAIEQITKKNGDGIIKVATQGDGKNWVSKRQFTSRRFTTNLDEIIEVKVK